MLAASTIVLISLLAFTSEAIAKPLSYRRAQALATRGNDSVSFSNWHNIASLQGFDDFNGRDNFDGSHNAQTIVVKETETRCQTVQVELIQQKLTILREMAKRIITEQICEVETQTIVFEQFHGSLVKFREDIQRKTTARQIGFDDSIARKVNTIIKEDGSLSLDDAGFKGSDVGKNTVVPLGNDWDDSKSPALVQAALDAVNSSVNSSQ
ncbi:hypothetical protein C8J57DRAFT_705274 [Mycena rebaudengoi]|nr:hypothetical protein C8J57DRAFT_705274 [Mycena rebaudengoi]